MNVTEKKGYKWLLAQGYSFDDIVFHPRRNPDFITADGNGYEVKRLYGRKIRFGTIQFEELQIFGGVKVLVFNDESDIPKEILEMSDLADNCIRRGFEVCVMTNSVGGPTTVELKNETKDRLVKIGAKSETYDDLINRVIDGYLKALS